MTDAITPASLALFLAYEGLTWPNFTDTGHALAAAHDVIIDPDRPPTERD